MTTMRAATDVRFTRGLLEDAKPRIDLSLLLSPSAHSLCLDIPYSSIYYSLFLEPTTTSLQHSMHCLWVLFVTLHLLSNKWPSVCMNWKDHNFEKTCNGHETLSILVKAGKQVNGYIEIKWGNLDVLCATKANFTMRIEMRNLPLRT